MPISTIITQECNRIVKQKLSIRYIHVSHSAMIANDTLKSRQALHGETVGKHIRPEFETNKFVFFSAYPTFNGNLKRSDRHVLDLTSEYELQKPYPPSLKIRLARPAIFEATRNWFQTVCYGVRITLSGAQKRPKPFYEFSSGPYDLEYTFESPLLDDPVIFVKKNMASQFEHKNASRIYTEQLTQVLAWLSMVKRLEGMKCFLSLIYKNNLLEGTIESLCQVLPVGEATIENTVDVTRLKKSFRFSGTIMPNILYSGNSFNGYALRLREFNALGFSPFASRIMAWSNKLRAAVESGSLSQYTWFMHTIGDHSQLLDKHYTSSLRIKASFFKKDLYYFYDPIKAYITPFIHAIIIGARDIIHHALKHDNPDLSLGAYRPGYYYDRYHYSNQENALFFAAKYFPEILSDLVKVATHQNSFFYLDEQKISIYAYSAHHLSHSTTHLLQNAGFEPEFSMTTYPYKTAKILSVMIEHLLEFPVVMMSTFSEGQYQLHCICQWNNSCGSEQVHPLQLKRFKKLPFNSITATPNTLHIFIPITLDSVAVLLYAIVINCFLDYQTAWESTYNRSADSYPYSLLGSTNYYGTQKVILPSCNAPFDFNLTVDIVDEELTMLLSDFKCMPHLYEKTRIDSAEPVADEAEKYLETQRPTPEELSPDQYQKPLEEYIQHALQFMGYFPKMGILDFVSPLKEPKFEGIGHFYGSYFILATSLLSGKLSEPGGHNNFSTLNALRIKKHFSQKDAAIEVPFHPYDEEFAGVPRADSYYFDSEEDNIKRPKFLTFAENQSNRFSMLIHPPALRFPMIEPDIQEFKPEAYILTIEKLRKNHTPHHNLREFYAFGKITTFFKELFKYLEKKISEHLTINVQIRYDEYESDGHTSTFGKVYNRLTQEELKIDPLLAHAVIESDDINTGIQHVQYDIDRILGYDENGDSIVTFTTDNLLSPVIFSTEYAVILIYLFGGGPITLSELSQKCHMICEDGDMMTATQSSTAEHAQLCVKTKSQTLLFYEQTVWKVLDTTTEESAIQFTLMRYLTIDILGIHFWPFMIFTASNGENHITRQQREDFQSIIAMDESEDIKALQENIIKTKYIREYHWVLLFIIGCEAAVSDDPKLIFNPISQRLLLANDSKSSFFQFTDLEDSIEQQIQTVFHPAWLSHFNTQNFYSTHEGKLLDLTSADFILEHFEDKSQQEIAKPFVLNINKRAQAFLNFMSTQQGTDNINLTSLDQ